MDDENTQEEKPKKKLDRVVTGGLVVKKKSWLERVGGSFFGEDAGSVGQYILYDVLIPAAKETLQDSVVKGVERLLFGDSARGDRVRRERDRSNVSYTNYYRGGRERERRDPRDRDREPLRISSRDTYNFDGLVIKERGEAEEVLSKLVDMIEEYNACSVADFYDMLGVTSEYTDRRWGWDSLGRATVERVRGGWIIDLPSPIRLD